MKVTLDAALMKGMLAFAGRQDIRFYLNSLLVETTETSAILVASDGHTLAAHRVAADDVEDHQPGLQVIVPRASLESVKPRRTGRAQTVSIEVGAGDAVPGMREGDVPLRRAIGERSVPVVDVQPVGAGAAAGQEDVGPAVAVEVTDADPAHRPLVEPGHRKRVRRMREAGETRCGTDIAEADGLGHRRQADSGGRGGHRPREKRATS